MYSLLLHTLMQILPNQQNAVAAGLKLSFINNAAQMMIVESKIHDPTHITN